MATEDVGLRLTLAGRRETAKGLADTTTQVRGIGVAAEDSSGRLGRALGAVGKLGGILAGAAAVGVGAAVGLGVAGAKAGLATAAANEQASISFTTMLGSAQAAGSFLGDLRDFAAKTPFEFPELQTAASSLVSAGIEADKVIPIMTSLGNATSGMGTGSEGVKRATVALQQMNAAGRITGEDLNQLRDAGVPVYDLLAAATGKSTEAVADLASKGKLGRTELTQLMGALESGKGLERFTGLMDAQSQSLTGMVSTLRDTVGAGLARAVEPWLPTVKAGIGDLSTAAGPFFDWLVAKSEQLAVHGPAALDAVKDAGNRVVAMAQGAAPQVKALLDSFGQGEGNGDALRQAGEGAMALGSALPQLATQMPSIASTLEVTGAVTGFLAQHIDTLTKYMPALAAGFVIWKVAQLGANVAAAASVPIKLLEMATTRGHTGALRANTAALVGDTAAQNAGIFARGRAVVALGLQKGATLVMAGVTKAAAAGQWLLNAAMSANPIGLVVAGIALLVAGVIVAYQKVGWFRTAVDAVWGALKTAGVWVKDLGLQIGVWMIEKVVEGKAKFELIKVAIGAFVDKVKDGFTWVKKLGEKIANLPGISLLGDAASAVGLPFPGRAAGGPVTAGQPYVVGERRPELFVPRVPGVILPSVPRLPETDGALAGASLGGGGDAHITLEVDGDVLARTVLVDFRRQLARA